MRMAGEDAPADLFSDVVNVRRGHDFNLVAAFAALNAAFDLPGWSHERMIAAGADPRAILAARDTRPQQRSGVAVWPVDIECCVAGRRMNPFERAAINRAAIDEAKSRPK